MLNHSQIFEQDYCYESAGKENHACPKDETTMKSRDPHDDHQPCRHADSYLETQHRVAP
jgi:hypothetical protein